MRHLNMSCHEAAKFVRSKRPAVYPNAGFHEQLHLWEDCGFDLQKRLMVDKETESDRSRLGCKVGVKKENAKGDGAKEERKVTQQEGGERVERKE